ncbi:MAG: radical SAM protein [Nitrospiraceae bacterium]|nr:MAG: radical SAM protein [Nitrospiraceae bacterium]
MYDPVEKARQVAEVVCKDGKRKYHRFRPAPFYGGIATADCVGCCLGCAFCWSWRQVAYGKFYSPEEVAHNLLSIARKKRFGQVRISGNEPTICRAHLLQVLSLIPSDLHFILETNGILIGADQSYATDLARFPNLHVRVSLKGTNEEEFARLTGARPEAFQLQLEALTHLTQAGVEAHPAVMVSFSPPSNIATLRERLAAIHPDFADFEVEELVLYSGVKERLERAGLAYRTAYEPASTPPAQI